MRRRIGQWSAAALCSAAALLACQGPLPPASAGPSSLYLVRHQASNAEPLGLGSGVVAVREQCLYLVRNLLVWPADYVMVEGDPPTVVGGGWTIAIGDTISVSGGEYERLDDLPSPLLTQAPPCPGPYLWVAETLTVEKP